MKWAYGVMTVPERRKELLPRTLLSLNRAGFPSPRLFVDGDAGEFMEWGLPVTERKPRLRTFGNWMLGLLEIYIREPESDRFAVFQDDIVCVRGLREYLERWYPEDGYLNLFTFPANEAWLEGKRGWHCSNQLGLGACALVFDRYALHSLFSTPYMVQRPLDAMRGWRAIDGGIVTAMQESRFKGKEWKEYVHSPSLVQHTGILSVMGNRPHPQSTTFPGEDFDVCSATQ